VYKIQECKIERLGLSEQVVSLLSGGLKSFNIAKILNHPEVTYNDIENFRNKHKKMAGIISSETKSIAKKPGTYHFDIINNFKKIDEEMLDLLKELKSGEVVITKDINGQPREVIKKDYATIMKLIGEIRQWTYLHKETVGELSRPGQVNINLNQTESLFSDFKDIVFKTLEKYPDAQAAILAKTSKFLLNDMSDNPDERIIDVEVEPDKEPDNQIESK